MDLRSLTKGYLEAEGYQVSSRGKDLLMGTRRSIGEDTETFYVWLPEIADSRSFRSQYGPLLNRFKEAYELQPEAKKFVLVPTLEGLTPEFRKTAHQAYNVRIRVPVQFFDTNFAWEESSEFRSAAVELRTRGLQSLRKRASQPYVIEDSDKRGDDILDSLFEKIRTRKEGAPSIHLIVGPAGMGKSYLFECLYARLYDAFLQDKNRRQTSPRPFPLLPEYLPAADAPTVKALLRAFLERDFSRPLEADVFEWMMTNGLALWMLDGLDEVIAQDPTFFDYFLDLMTRPGGDEPPQIVLCVRDSLLATNDELREFCEDFSEYVEVSELKPWGDRSKRQFARMVLGQRADEFIGKLKERPELDRLASTAYYCDLLVSEFDAGDLHDEYSEADLLQHALSAIIAREYDKELISEEVIAEDDVTAFLEALAAEDLESGFTGIKVDEARDWAALTLPSDVDPNDVDRFVDQMVQLALFSFGGLGHIRFAQENLEHYLLGRGILKLYEQRKDEVAQDAFMRRLAVRQIPPDWVTLRFVGDFIRDHNEFQELMPLLYQAQRWPNAFKNVLQVAIPAATIPTALNNIPLERQNLSGLVFRDLDLSDVSFRASDLSDVEFVKCSLKGANLQEAIIKNTLFDVGKDGLKGAKIGDLSAFYSMRAPKQGQIADHTAASKWFKNATGTSVDTVAPCSSALQLRFLFNKFVRPDGSARRDSLDLRGVVSGKRFADPRKVLDAAVRGGYLFVDEHKGSVTRPSGDAYSEMCSYTTSLDISPGIGAVLKSVCKRKGCEHVPKGGLRAA